MPATERKYTVIGLAMALVLAGFVLGYRALTSDADSFIRSPNDRANHHPKSAVAPE